MRYLLPTIAPLAADLSGTAAFYLLFLVTGDARIGAGTGLAIGLAQLGWHRRRGRRAPALLMVGVALTVTLGGMTLLTDDPRFLLVKPSIVYAAVALTMLPRGWVRRYVPARGLELLPARTFDRVGWGWAALLFGTAALNLALVATLPPVRAATWFLVGGIASKLLLFAGQYVVLRRRAGQLAIQRTPSSASSRS